MIIEIHLVTQLLHRSYNNLLTSSFHFQLFNTFVYKYEGFSLLSTGLARYSPITTDSQTKDDTLFYFSSAYRFLSRNLKDSPYREETADILVINFEKCIKC